MRSLPHLLVALVATLSLPAAASAMDHASMAGMADVPGMTHHATAPSEPAAAPVSASAFEVGTELSPLVARGAKGPLWKATPPSPVGETRHGTFAQQYVAAELADARAERTAATAGLTTAQATKKLTKRCQRLLKKRTSKLSKADRKRRSDCLKKRRKIIADSKRTPATTTPTPTTPSTPTAPVATTPPASNGPAPTTPPATTPSGPVYAAVGVKAIDGDVQFQLTRGVAQANIVNFELTNTDSQVHNLAIQQRGKPETVENIIDFLAPPAGGAAPTRANKNVTLPPGEYELVCRVKGHGPMTVPFTVVAP